MNFFDIKQEYKINNTNDIQDMKFLDLLNFTKNMFDYLLLLESNQIQSSYKPIPLFNLLTNETTDTEQKNKSIHMKFNNFNNHNDSTQSSLSLTSNEYNLYFAPENKIIKQKDSVGTITANNYVILSILGKGSQGTVYSVQDVYTSQVYALKEIRGKINKYNMKLLLNINHINLAKIKEILNDDEYFYVVMEYYENAMNNIFELSYVTIMSILYQVSMGLYWMHKRKIVHRDIKLDNIIYTKDGIVKIVDFGISLHLKNKKIVLQQNTPLYTAPEIITHNECTQKVDVWSVGILMYYLLYGTYPFNGATIQELYNNITNSPIIFPEYASSNDIALITELLQKNPKKRCSIKKFLKDEYVIKNINSTTANLYNENETSAMSLIN